MLRRVGNAYRVVWLCFNISRQNILFKFDWAASPTFQAALIKFLDLCKYTKKCLNHHHNSSNHLKYLVIYRGWSSIWSLITMVMLPAVSTASKWLLGNSCAWQLDNSAGSRWAPLATDWLGYTFQRQSNKTISIHGNHWVRWGHQIEVGTKIVWGR